MRQEFIIKTFSFNDFSVMYGYADPGGPDILVFCSAVNFWTNIFLNYSITNSKLNLEIGTRRKDQGAKLSDVNDYMTKILVLYRCEFLTSSSQQNPKLVLYYK